MDNDVSQDDRPPFFNHEEFVRVTIPNWIADASEVLYRVPKNLEQALKLLVHKTREQLAEGPATCFLLACDFDQYDEQLVQAKVELMNSCQQANLADFDAKTIFYIIRGYIDRVKPNRIPIAQDLAQKCANLDFQNFNKAFRADAFRAGAKPQESAVKARTCCNQEPLLRSFYYPRYNEFIVAFLEAEAGNEASRAEKHVLNILLRTLMQLVVDYTRATFSQALNYADDSIMIKLAYDEEPRALTTIINRLCENFASLIFRVELEFVVNTLVRYPRLIHRLEKNVFEVTSGVAKHVLRNMLFMNHLRLFDQLKLNAKLIHRCNPCPLQYCYCKNVKALKTAMESAECS